MRVAEFRIGDMEFVVASYPAADASVLARLTKAERAVALLAAEGQHNREIARRRGSSERTVANQLASIFKKLGVASRAELACLIAGAPGP